MPEQPLAIASGITPENVGDYLPWADCFLVATGISATFTELDPARLAALVERVRGAQIVCYSSSGSAPRGVIMGNADRGGRPRSGSDPVSTLETDGPRPDPVLTPASGGAAARQNNGAWP